jgi:hypothetical protein
MKLDGIIKDEVVIIPFEIYRQRVMVFLTGLYCNDSVSDSDSNAINETIESFLSELIHAHAEEFVNITKDDFFEPVTLPYSDGTITEALMVFVQVERNLIPVYALEKDEIDQLNLAAKFIK